MLLAVRPMLAGVLAAATLKAGRPGVTLDRHLVTQLKDEQHARQQAAASATEVVDIDAILARTPRPHRKKSASVFSISSREQGRSATKPSPKIDDHSEHSLSSIYSSLLDDHDDLNAEGSGSESDSSLDIHTPLP